MSDDKKPNGEMDTRPPMTRIAQTALALPEMTVTEQRTKAALKILADLAEIADQLLLAVTPPPMVKIMPLAKGDRTTAPKPFD